MNTGQSKTQVLTHVHIHANTNNLAHNALWLAVDKKITAVNQHSVILTATHSVVIDTGSFDLECG